MYLNKTISFFQFPYVYEGIQGYILRKILLGGGVNGRLEKIENEPLGKKFKKEKGKKGKIASITE